MNAHLYCQQLDRANQFLIENCPGIVNRKEVILHRTLKKINELGWEVLPHPPNSTDIAPLDFHLFRSLQHFICDKKFENLDDIKYPPDILLKNLLIFIDPALNIYTLDGKRLLITRVITSLIKNKILLKIDLFQINVKNDTTSRSP